ncbi:GntR family transcriptional regulator [Intrasporangium mesophilum]
MRIEGIQNQQAAPAFARIAEELRERIAHMPPHTLLPSEREIGEEFQVSRMTARQAVTVLESEGSVYRRPPRGTFVAEPRVRFQVGSFTEQVERLGKSPQARVLEARTIAASGEQAKELNLSPGSLVHALKRLRLVDGEPLAIEQTALPAELMPGFLDHRLDGSLWALMSDTYDVTPKRAYALLESRSLDREAATLLGVREGAPGILMTRRTVDAVGVCVEYAIDTYRADRAAFEFAADVGPISRHLA